MAHFFAHQVLNNAYLRDLIGPADPDASDFLVSQEPVCQLLTDAPKHLTEVIDLYDVRVILKHGVFLHGDASYDEGPPIEP